MDLIECYLMTSRVALQANCTDPTTWQEMHTLLPNLHRHLSCRVCNKLLDEPDPPHTDSFACTACVNHKITERASSSVVQCYKKLCAYIQKSPLYDAMCARDEDRRLVELLTEVIGVSFPINGHKGLVNGNMKKPVDALNIFELNSSPGNQLPGENKMSSEYVNVQIFDVQSQKRRIQNQTLINIIPKRKKNERRWGCRCGNATNNPGKLTCFGQRCPCYTEQRPCDQCKCRGCRNPRQKSSNNDDNLEIDRTRRKPVTLELVSTLKPQHIKSNQAFGTYTMHDMLQFPSHSQHFDQSGTEVTLGQY